MHDIIIRECTAVHFSFRDAIFEYVDHKCSPLRRHVAAADTDQVVQLGLIDNGLH